MKMGFYYKIIVGVIGLMGGLSCKGICITKNCPGQSGGVNPVSSSVRVEMYEQRPVVHYKGIEQAVCRKGLPLDLADRVPVWDVDRVERGREALGEGVVLEADQEREDEILTSVSDYWFKVVPLISNESPFHIVINKITFRARIAGSREGFVDVTRESGYCETSPLYYFDNSGGGRADPPPPEAERRSYTTVNHIDELYSKGNLVFYVDGLPALERSGESESRNLPDPRIPTYQVEWFMEGYFSNVEGERVAEFKKRGYFNTRPASF